MILKGMSQGLDISATHNSKDPPKCDLETHETIIKEYHKMDSDGRRLIVDNPPDEF